MTSTNAGGALLTCTVCGTSVDYDDAVHVRFDDATYSVEITDTLTPLEGPAHAACGRASAQVRQWLLVTRMLPVSLPGMVIPVAGLREWVRAGGRLTARHARLFLEELDRVVNGAPDDSVTDQFDRTQLLLPIPENAGEVNHARPTVTGFFQQCISAQHMLRDGSLFALPEDGLAPPPWRTTPEGLRYIEEAALDVLPLRDVDLARELRHLLTQMTQTQEIRVARYMLLCHVHGVHQNRGCGGDDSISPAEWTQLRDWIRAYEVVIGGHPLLPRGDD